MRHHKIVKRLRALMALFVLVTLAASNLSVVYAAGPTVSVTSPVNGSIQQGVVELTAASSADTLGVTFKLSGPGIANTTFPEDTTAPYSTQWDSTVWSPGTLHINKADYTIIAEARGTGGTTASTPVKVKLNNSPIDNKVMVVGDSVTQQAFDPNADGTDTYTANTPAVADLLLFKKMGWSTKDVQTTVNNYSIFRQPKKLVVAMGLNDAGTFFSDGWNADDLERFRTLINTPHADTCIALVLPGHAATGETAWFNSWATEIDEARAALAELATTRPHTITIDWQTVINDHPEYVDDDGVHLPTPDSTPMEDLMDAGEGRMNPVDPAAAAARQEFYWEGAGKCEAPSATFQTPTADATVEGTIPLSVNVTGPAPSVQFQVDGQNIGSSVTSAPFQIDWDSTTKPDGTPMTNGLHTITAVSTNPAGSHIASVSVNVQNPPIPGTVEVVGDSITFQSFYSSTGMLPAAPDEAHRDLHFGLGWHVATPEVMPHVIEKAANRWPETLIVALGTNDASPYHGGWTSADLERFRTLINTVHTETKVVLVLPGYGAGINPAHAVQMDLAKQDLTTLATTRPHTIVVTWQDKIDADPSIMDVDGIHLAFELNPDGTRTGFTVPHAAAVRQQLYWDAWQLALQN